MQCIDGFSLLLQRFVRKGNDAKNPAIFSFCSISFPEPTCLLVSTKTRSHACAVKPEVLKYWSLEIDYSRASCLGADQKARGLWERDWLLFVSERTQLNATHAQLLEKLRPIALAETCRFLMHQSIPAVPIPPPPGLTPGH